MADKRETTDQKCLKLVSDNPTPKVSEADQELLRQYKIKMAEEMFAGLRWTRKDDDQ